MPGTSATWPHIVNRALAADGHDELSVPPELQASHGADRASATAGDEFWARVEALPLSRPLGITMARVVDYVDFQELGIALATSPTIQHAATLLSEYGALLSDAVSVSWREQQDTVVLTITAHPSEHWRTQEFAAAALVRFTRARFGAQTSPRSVRLGIPSGHDLRPYARYFRAPVTLGAPLTEVEFSSDIRSHATPTALLERQLNEALRAAVDRLAPNVSGRVRASLTHQLAGGPVAVSDIASAHYVSARTLQRQLGEEGTTFRALRDEVTSRLAFEWTAHGSLSMSEIAHQLGFRSPSAFTRAFRRWHGQTPSQLRAAQRELVEMSDKVVPGALSDRAAAATGLPRQTHDRAQRRGA